MSLKTYITMPVMVLLIAVLNFSTPAHAAEKEQLVKAAFVYNFIKFVGWPSPISVAEVRTLSICQLGDNQLGSATSMFKEVSSPTLAITTRSISAMPSAVGECHIILVGQAYAGQLSAILPQAALVHALTVSDIDEFAEKGGVIGFVKSENKVRLHINRNAAESSGLKLDAQLLEIARKVIG